jgi:hypothetical protein
VGGVNVSGGLHGALNGLLTLMANKDVCCCLSARPLWVIRPNTRPRLLKGRFEIKDPNFFENIS